MTTITPLIPLLTAAGILLAGNGVQGALIALRGAEEGFSAEFIGLLGSGYFAGFLLGCYLIPKILRAVGHIRAFSALAAIAASSMILLVTLVEPVSWVILRFIAGICFSGLFTTMESWLNAASQNADRGRILSLYRLVDLGAVTSAQFLIPVFGIEGFAIFGIIAVMTCLSIVPVSLADRSNPEPPKSFEFNIKRAFALSPIACIGCVTIGLTNSAFRLVGPLYARDIGLSVVDVATFMSAGILGGAVLQYPIGLLSDKVDRRLVLILATCGAVAASFYLASMAGRDPILNYAGIFMFGAFAMPLYSLSAAHANDHVSNSGNKSDFVLMSAALLFFFSIGAIIGPLAASWFLKIWGPQALFTYICAVHSLLIALTIWRIFSRPAVEGSKRSRFVTLLRTSTQIFKIANTLPKGDDKDDGPRGL